MKPSDISAICLTSGLMLAVTALAVTPDGQGNPYQGIVVRNVFALKPPPDPTAEASKVNTPPPPPIELQGISSMFGKQQVLFSATVPGGKPNEPPKKTSFMLAVGQSQDEIEVLAINEAAGTVKFRNHGVEEEKSLDKDSAKVVATAPVTPFPGVVPGKPGVAPPMAVGAPNPAGGGNVTVLSSGAAMRNIPNIPSRTMRGPTTGGGISTTQQRALSPEEQILMMKAIQEVSSVPGGNKLLNPGSGYTPPMPPMPPMPQLGQ